MTTLPPGWTWTTLGDVALSVKNGIFVSRPGADPDGVPILRISAVRPGQLDLTDIRYSGTEAGALASADQLVSTSDLLFTRYNGNIDYVGACAIVPHAVGALTYPDKLIRVRIDTAVADPAYVCYAFQTPAVRAEVRKSARTTAGQAGISGSNLRRIGFPLPPLAEQRRIVAALEESLSHYASGIKSVQQAQSRLRVLRQAIFDFVATGRVASTAADDAPPRSENADLVNGWQWRRPHELTTGERSDIAIGPFGHCPKVKDIRPPWVDSTW